MRNYPVLRPRPTGPVRMVLWGYDASVGQLKSVIDDTFDNVSEALACRNLVEANVYAGDITTLDGRLVRCLRAGEILH